MGVLLDLDNGFGLQIWYIRTLSSSQVSNIDDKMKRRLDKDNKCALQNCKIHVFLFDDFAYLEGLTFNNTYFRTINNRLTDIMWLSVCIAWFFWRFEMNKQETSPYKPVKWNLFLIAISFAPAVFKMHGKKPFPSGFTHDNYILLFFHIMTVLQYTLYGMIRNIMTYDTIEFEQYIETFLNLNLWGTHQQAE